MDYLAAAKRGISAEQKYISIEQEQISRRKETRINENKKKLDADAIQFELENSELVQSFHEFASERDFVVFRHESGELYFDAHTYVMSFKFWANNLNIFNYE